MTLFREDAEFSAAIEIAAERLGVLPVVVEKDYYVTEALRVLAVQFDGDWVFKGGTSLSKGFGILNRFSEDIDVLVLRHDRGRGAMDRVMKSMGEATAQVLAARCERHGGADRGIHRSYEIHYGAIHQGGPVLPYVLLEMGVRGGPEPAAPRLIRTMLGPALGLDEDEYDDLRPFSVPVLHPGRTLLEKLGLLHAAAVGYAEHAIDLRAARLGRHFYDVHQILGYQPARELLLDRDEVSRILGEAAAISQEQFGTYEPRPAGGFAKSPAFGKRTRATDDAFRDAYEDAKALALGGEPWPDWDAVQARVREHAELL